MAELLRWRSADSHCRNIFPGRLKIYNRILGKQIKKVCISKLLFLKRTARTRQLITTAVDHLRLKREGEYFGLAFKSKNGCDHYLDPNKCLHDQLPKTTHNQNKPALRFRVRFYPPDPQRLKEEAARHWLYLQMRADMLSGSLGKAHL